MNRREFLKWLGLGPPAAAALGGWMCPGRGGDREAEEELSALGEEWACEVAPYTGVRLYCRGRGYSVIGMRPGSPHDAPLAWCDLTLRLAGSERRAREFEQDIAGELLRPVKVEIVYGDHEALWSCPVVMTEFMPQIRPGQIQCSLRTAGEVVVTA